MGRGMTAAVAAEIAGGAVRLFHLVELRFDSGTQFRTDAHRDIAWGGNTYAGDGNLLSVGEVSESVDIRTGQLRLSLSGVAQANIATALSEPYTDREVFIYRGFLDAADYVIVNPYLHYAGRIDTFGIDEDPDQGASTVSWTVASHWVDFEKTGGRRTNHADQGHLFPGDEGFAFSSQVATDITWGRV